MLTLDAPPFLITISYIFFECTIDTISQTLLPQKISILTPKFFPDKNFALIASSYIILPLKLPHFSSNYLKSLCICHYKCPILSRVQFSIRTRFGLLYKSICSCTYFTLSTLYSIFFLFLL